MGAKAVAGAGRLVKTSGMTFRTFKLWLAAAELAAGAFLASARAAAPTAPPAPTTALGLFTTHQDIGAVGHAGSVEFDPASGRYILRGGGANLWGTNDAFHFVWREASGDFTLTADLRWLAPGGNPHRKALLMVRQDTGPAARYVDAAWHGDGLTSLQFREEPGGPTREIQSPVRAPRRLRLDKQGETFWMSVAGEDGVWRPAGGAHRVKFTEPFLVGLGVCAHDDARVEAAEFSAVTFTPHATNARTPPVLYSTLEVVNLASLDRRVVLDARAHFEAPNWSRDGRTLLINRAGRLYQVPVSGGEPVVLDTGFAVRCNNDHGYSPDGAWLAISDQSQGDGKSRIYVLPATGGTPRLVTEQGPSYWHGWSPDGATLAYCAERNGEYDIYTIPVRGGPERRLTTAPGLDDGPDYSPDGQWIYFNSERSGRMQIWRMRPDGSGQEQVTHDEWNNWFPHPSPDGRWIVFLSYAREVQGHPANQDVRLRLLPTAGGEPRELARLFGGQGTLNVPSWSPDSRAVAFVSYRLVRERP